MLSCGFDGRIAKFLTQVVVIVLTFGSKKYFNGIIGLSFCLWKQGCPYYLLSGGNCFSYLCSTYFFEVKTMGMIPFEYMIL